MGLATHVHWPVNVIKDWHDWVEEQTPVYHHTYTHAPILEQEIKVLVITEATIWRLTLILNYLISELTGPARTWK